MDWLDRVLKRDLGGTRTGGTGCCSFLFALPSCPCWFSSPLSLPTTLPHPYFSPTFPALCALLCLPSHAWPVPFPPITCLPLPSPYPTCHAFWGRTGGQASPRPFSLFPSSHLTPWPPCPHTLWRAHLCAFPHLPFPLYTPGHFIAHCWDLRFYCMIGLVWMDGWDVVCIFTMPPPPTPLFCAFALLFPCCLLPFWFIILLLNLYYCFVFVDNVIVRSQQQPLLRSCLFPVGYCYLIYLYALAQPVSIVHFIVGLNKILLLVLYFGFY